LVTFVLFWRYSFVITQLSLTPFALARAHYARPKDVCVTRTAAFAASFGSHDRFYLFS